MGYRGWRTPGLRPSLQVTQRQALPRPRGHLGGSRPRTRRRQRTLGDPLPRRSTAPAAGRPSFLSSSRIPRKHQAGRGKGPARPDARDPAAETSSPRGPLTTPATAARHRPVAAQPSARAAPGRRRRLTGRGGREGRERRDRTRLPPRAAPQPATCRGKRRTRHLRCFVQHRGNGGLEGIGSPGKGARQRGRAAAAASIGLGSCPSTRDPAPSADAPPRLVWRRPEGSGVLPVVESCPVPPGVPAARRITTSVLAPVTVPETRTPPSPTQTPVISRLEREVGFGEELPGCSNEGLPQVGRRGGLVPLRPRGLEKCAGLGTTEGLGPRRGLFFVFLNNSSCSSPLVPRCW
nr:serine/arginine repetitive matrix protein 1-like [Loxodonta africana]